MCCIDFNGKVWNYIKEVNVMSNINLGEIAKSFMDIV